MTDVVGTQNPQAHGPGFSPTPNFLAEIENIKFQHEENHKSASVDKNENVYKLQARFLHAYKTQYKSLPKEKQKAIKQQFEEEISAKCFNLKKGAPLERFIHYTFHFTSWRTPEFVKDVKQALKNNIAVDAYPSWVIKHGSIIDRLEPVVYEIHMLGQELKKHEGNVQQVAIRGLNQIYSIAVRLYEGASPEQKSKIFLFFKKKCRADGYGSSDKNTTIFHVLSKMYRRANDRSIRQKASDDALILRQASNDNVKVEEFEVWILNQGGLSKALLNARKKAKPRSDKPKPENERPEKPFKQGLTISLNGKTAPKAFKVLQSGKSYSATIVAGVDGRFDIVINERKNDAQGKNVAAKKFIRGNSIKGPMTESKGEMQFPLSAQHRLGIRKTKIRATKLKSARLVRA